MDLFPGYHPTSKVWIYTSPRPFSAVEADFIRENLASFCAEWAAHGTQLKAAGDVLHDRFVVLVADESQTSASGCSIDTSVRFIKQLSNELGLDLFNRMIFYSEDFNKIDFSDLSEQQINVFNTMVRNLDELRAKWIVPANELLAIQ